MEYLVHDEEETKKIAESIGEKLQAGDCLVLTGELGAGKTTFTKGIAKGLGIEQMVKSPTYTIVREYSKGRLPLFHMDVYRLENGAEDLALDEYYEQEGVTIIEWGKMIENELPSDYVEIILTYREATTMRKIELFAIGVQGQELLKRITD